MHLLPEIQVLQLYFNACKNKKASPIFTSVYHLLLDICNLFFEALPPQQPGLSL